MSEILFHSSLCHEEQSIRTPHGYSGVLEILMGQGSGLRCWPAGLHSGAELSKLAARAVWAAW
jgi:hypothetical protein